MNEFTENECLPNFELKFKFSKFKLRDSFDIGFSREIKVTMSAISVFRVKFNVEFTHWAVIFSIE